MSEAGSTGKPEAKPEDTQAQLEKLNKQLADLRAQKDKEDADKKKSKDTRTAWLIGIVAFLVLAAIIIGVVHAASVQQAKDNAENNYEIAKMACDAYGHGAMRDHCRQDPENYNPSDDPDALAY